MADLEYTFDGLFYFVVPNSAAGEDICRQLCEQNDGSNKVLFTAFAGFKAAVKAANATIRKARPRKSNMSDDELYAALA